MLWCSQYNQFVCAVTADFTTSKYDVIRSLVFNCCPVFGRFYECFTCKPRERFPGRLGYPCMYSSLIPRLYGSSCLPSKLRLFETPVGCCEIAQCMSEKTWHACRVQLPSASRCYCACSTISPWGRGPTQLTLNPQPIDSWYYPSIWNCQPHIKKQTPKHTLPAFGFTTAVCMYVTD